VDTAYDVGEHCSLAIDGSGCPHIVYRDGCGDIRHAYSSTPPVATLWGELSDSEIVLSWIPIPSASAYWVYGAANIPHFPPGFAPDCLFRLAVVPAGSTTWSSGSGVGDTADNWTYMVIAVDDVDSELWRSNRVGEFDALLP
jgi:hypothetical protein